METLPSSILGPVSPVLDHVRNPCVGIVHLTESPTSSSGQSSPSSLSMSPSAFSAFHLSSKTPRSRPSITPLLLTHLQGSSAAPLAPPSRTRARFILAGDFDYAPTSETNETHSDESDESDQTSFFSNEHSLPTITSAGYSAPKNGDGKAINSSSGKLSGESSETHKQRTCGEPHDAANNVEIADSLHGLRRWHALMEIVQTEADYVRDLRKLVNVSVAMLFDRSWVPDLVLNRCIFHN
jgi:hypothetical protein